MIPVIRVTSKGAVAARAIFAAIVLSALPTIASAQHVNSDLWVTPNGTINASALVGNTLYIGGAFRYVGPHTGGGVPLGAASGAAITGFPKVRGTVRAVAGDGSGGWFIGGTFDSVGGAARVNLAHIRSDFTVAAWAPNPNGIVYALAVSGSTVYAGGLFSSIGGLTRNNLAAIDAATAVVSGWDPNANSYIYALAVSDTTVYAGGYFTTIRGQTRNYIAAIGVASAIPTNWNPNANNPIQALAVSGSTVYAGGVFSSIGDSSRIGLAALDAASGSATSWNPSPNSGVYALAVSGSKVYAGGAFGSIGGQVRGRIAAIDVATGLPTNWNPSADSYVYTLAVSGQTVYAGGFFSTIGGQERTTLAALDAATGLATSWNPNPNQANVYALAAGGSTVYAGGDFACMGGVARHYIAALDVTTGKATSWDPDANSFVYALAVHGNTVYAGGGFYFMHGVRRNGLAALDMTTGLPTPWDPDAGGSGVFALAVRGPTVYAGGTFTTIGGQTRNHIAAIDSAAGTPMNWNPNANGNVYALALIGSTVYAGGSFSSMSGQTRNYLAAIDSTGSLTGWNPNADNQVYALTVNGSTVYVGGAFGHVGAQTRVFLGAVDATTGLATGFIADASNYGVTALAVSGSTVYAGGSFYSINGQTRYRIAAVNATTGAVASWNPNASGYSVLSLVVGGSTVYAGGDFSAMGGVPSPGIAAVSAYLGISQVQPDHGGDVGPVSVVVQGVGFQSGSTAKLARPGQSDIVGTLVTVGTGGDSLAATFNLAGKPNGVWDLIVTNPDGSFAILPQGFTVEPEIAPQLRVGLIGRSLIRANRRNAYDLVIENPGNIDALAVPLWISGVPANGVVEPDFAITPPIRITGEPDWSAVPLTFTSPGGQYLPIVIPRARPGITVRRIFVTVPPATPTFQLRASLTPPWVDGNPFRACLTGGGVISDPACMGTQLNGINTFLASNPQLQALSGIGAWAKIAWHDGTPLCQGAGSLASAIAKAEQVLDFMIQPIEVPGSAIASCSGVLPPRWRETVPVTIVGSIDPNDKLGVRDTVSVRQAIPYSIRFENLSTATAPAQQVVVSDPLPLGTLDPNTVSLDVITLGNVHIVPPPGLRSYATQVDLRPSRNLLVNISAGVDPFTGVLTWYFTSLDPATGQPPTDPLAGFLPPNQIPPEGEGSVLFTVMPRPTLGSGTQISNGATIVFDENAPLNTPPWLNTVDDTPPASHVLPLAANSDLPSVPVSWTAPGTPQDLRDFTVFVAEDGAPFRVWRLNTSATTDTLVPPGDHLVHQYKFYSVARDMSGNIESPPTSPDAVTQSRTAVGDVAGALQLALEGARPNPALGPMRVWFTLPSRERATLDVIDVAGRRMIRREVGSLGPGTHSLALDDSPPLRPGLYFLRLAQGPRMLSTRVAVIQ